MRVPLDFLFSKHADLPAGVRYIVHFSVVVISFIAFLNGFIIRVLFGVLHFRFGPGLGLALLGLVASVSICKTCQVLVFVH